MAQASDVYGMGEVAAGIPGCQVRQPHGRWSNSAYAQQEALDGMGEVAVHCCRDGPAGADDSARTDADDQGQACSSNVAMAFCCGTESESKSCPRQISRQV